MKIFSGFIIHSIVFLILAGCGISNSTSNPIPIPSQLSQSTPDADDTENLPTPTKTAWSSFTPPPSRTPDLTQTVVSQGNSTAGSAKQTLIAQYPHICKNTLAPQEYSPDNLWLAEFCYSEEDSSLILTLSNKKSKVVYKLVSRDYIPNTDHISEAGLGIVFWPPDQNYAYFASFPMIDGGECFLAMNSEYIGYGLFRLDLQTGNVTTILSPQSNFRSYSFSFSPTGRRIIYQTRDSALKILDIKTGETISVSPAIEDQFSGGYLWSSDGLRFAYSTVLYNDNGPINYSIRLMDTQSGNERILIESPNQCFLAKGWSGNNNLTVESYGDYPESSIIEYDLNSNQVISEATITPVP